MNPQLTDLLVPSTRINLAEQVISRLSEEISARVHWSTPNGQFTFVSTGVSEHPFLLLFRPYHQDGSSSNKSAGASITKDGHYEFLRGTTNLLDAGLSGSLETWLDKGLKAARMSNLSCELSQQSPTPLSESSNTNLTKDTIWDSRFETEITTPLTSKELALIVEMISSLKYVPGDNKALGAIYSEDRKYRRQIELDGDLSQTSFTAENIELTVTFIVQPRKPDMVRCSLTARRLDEDEQWLNLTPVSARMTQSGAERELQLETMSLFSPPGQALLAVLEIAQEARFFAASYIKSTPHGLSEEISRLHSKWMTRLGECNCARVVSTVFGMDALIAKDPGEQSIYVTVRSYDNSAAFSLHSEGRIDVSQEFGLEIDAYLIAALSRGNITPISADSRISELVTAVVTSSKARTDFIQFLVQLPFETIRIDSSALKFPAQSKLSSSTVPSEELISQLETLFGSDLTFTAENVMRLVDGKVEVIINITNDSTSEGRLALALQAFCIDGSKRTLLNLDDHTVTLIDRSSQHHNRSATLGVKIGELYFDEVRANVPYRVALLTS